MSATSYREEHSQATGGRSVNRAAEAASSASKAVATRISSLSAMVLTNMETKSGSVTRVLSKKAGRAKERLMQNFGKADKTTDELFEVYHDNFNKQHNTAMRLQKEMKNYVTCLRGESSSSSSSRLCFYCYCCKSWALLTMLSAPFNSRQKPICFSFLFLFTPFPLTSENP